MYDKGENTMEKVNVKIGTIIRTVILVLALVNQALTIAGKSPLPVSDEQVTELLSMLFTVVASLWSWWKNNSFTRAAIVADEMLADMRASE